MFKHLTYELRIKYFFVQQAVVIRVCYYWSKWKGHLIVGYPVQLITFIIGPVYLRFRKYCGRSVGKILTYRGPRQDVSFEVVVLYM